LMEEKSDLLRLLDEAEVPEGVYHSNAIENSTLTLPETEKILLGQELARHISIREVFEAKNLATVLNYVKTTATQRKLNNDTILLLHKMLITNIDDQIAGRYRSEGEYVRVGQYIAPAPEHIEAMMRELILEYYSQDNQPFLDRIAEFHLEFEKIHPFLDGNGRTGRALINYQLIELGYPPLILRVQDKTDYFKCFHEYHDRQKTKLLIKQLELALTESLHRRIAYLQGARIINLTEYARQIGQPENSTLNKAKRQSLPAFREQGQWKIGVAKSYSPSD